MVGYGHVKRRSVESDPKIHYFGRQEGNEKEEDSLKMENTKGMLWKIKKGGEYEEIACYGNYKSLEKKNRKA